MNYLPIAIRLKDKRVVIVGAGKVSERKIFNFLEVGAKVYVIAPEATPEIKRLARKGKIIWFPRQVMRSDLRSASLIISATNDKEVNRYVSKVAREFQAPVNVVDNPVLSDFISPALARFKKALIAVYTDSKDPVLSRDLKNYLKENWDGFVSYRSGL